MRPEAAAAVAAYRSWGYQALAEIRPAGPSSPLYNVMVLPLPAV